MQIICTQFKCNYLKVIVIVKIMELVYLDDDPFFYSSVNK